MTARTSYGLDTPRGTHWADRAACSPVNGRVDPEWWWPMPGAVDPDARRAAHICQVHCPVLSACRRDAREHHPRHPVILGGVRYGVNPRNHYTTVESSVQASGSGCPYCRESS